MMIWHDSMSILCRRRHLSLASRKKNHILLDENDGFSFLSIFMDEFVWILFDVLFR